MKQCNKLLKFYKIDSKISTYSSTFGNIFFTNCTIIKRKINANLNIEKRTTFQLQYIVLPYIIYAIFIYFYYMMHREAVSLETFRYKKLFAMPRKLSIAITRPQFSRLHFYYSNNIM